MIRVRHPSLELNWLPLSTRKSIETPRVFLLPEEQRFGGFYMRREPERCVVDVLDADLKEGAVIAICAAPNAGTIAHEYRHHWQIQSGYKFGSSIWPLQPNITMDEYKRGIIEYFTGYWWEMDALRFQVKHAPDEHSLEWAEWLRTAQTVAGVE